VADVLPGSKIVYLQVVKKTGTPVLSFFRQNYTPHPKRQLSEKTGTKALLEAYSMVPCSFIYARPSPEGIQLKKPSRLVPDNSAYYKGSPAVSLKPVAFRPCLATGLAFSPLLS